MTTAVSERPSTPVRVLAGDIDGRFVSAARARGLVAWDIETSGLDWRSDAIATCQLHVPGVETVVVRLSGSAVPPLNMRAMLADGAVRKIFHHAMFDLRFMARAWHVTPDAVVCTKIASKLASPASDPADHSLAPLVRRFLGVRLDKTLQRSDWLADELTPEQLAYAVGDVVHLPDLADALLTQLRANGLADLADRCFAHLPTRVELELGGYGDPFTY